MDNNEAFEIDAKSYGYLLEKAECGCCTYADDATEHRWCGWQAAQQQNAGEIATLKIKIDDVHQQYQEKVHELDCDKNELKADNEQLREAFKELAFIVQNRQSPSCQKGVIDKCRCTTCVIERGNATPSQSLQAHDDEVLERAALVCDEQMNEGECPERAEYCAEAIRALKG